MPALPRTTAAASEAVRPFALRRAFFPALCLIAVLVFAVRFAIFRDTEPHSDATYYAVCLRDVISADHAMPARTANESFAHALMGDEKSLLFALGRPVYSGPQWAFMQVSFLTEAVLLAFLRYSYAHVIALSILGSVLTLLPLTLLFRRCAGVTGWAGLTAALLYAASAYAFLYSPWGVHNWGVLALVTATAVAAPLMADTEGWKAAGGKRILILGGATLVAAYSHFTNPILAPLSMTLGLASLPGVAARRKFALISLYGVVVCAGLAPVALLSLATHKFWLNFGSYASVGGSPGSYLAGMVPRAGEWVDFGIRMFSLPGLILGVGGLAGMARTTPFRLPFLTAAAHFLCYCLIPGFIWNGSHTYLRTYNYVLPFLALGTGWAIVTTLRRGFAHTQSLRVLRGAVAVGSLWYLVAQIPFGGYAAWAGSHVPDFVDDYITGQGRLRPLVSDVERVASGAPLVFWNNIEEWVYLSLADKTSHVERSSVTALLDRRTRGEPLRAQVPASEYILASDAEGPDSFSEAKLSAALLTLTGRAAHIQAMGVYPTGVPLYARFRLYRVDLAPPAGGEPR